MDKYLNFSVDLFSPSDPYCTTVTVPLPCDQIFTFLWNRQCAFSVFWIFLVKAGHSISYVNIEFQLVRYLEGNISKGIKWQCHDCHFCAFEKFHFDLWLKSLGLVCFLCCSVQHKHPTTACRKATLIFSFPLFHNWLNCLAKLLKAVAFWKFKFIKARGFFPVCIFSALKVKFYVLKHFCL